jgi:hypothetical protein
MQKVITSLVLLMMFHVSFAQELFYYYQGEKIPLKMSNEKIYVKFREDKTENEK